jgi:multiple sugar transport system substrate-binding protein
MSHPDRRRFLELSAAGIGGAALAGGWPATAYAAETSPFKPEKGASLQLLRWKGFVAKDDEIWAANTAKFEKATGIKVTIDSLSWPDVTPKAALAAQVGSGPDIIMGWNDDPFVYPDKLVDMSDLAEYLGKAHGGYFDTARTYCYDPEVKRWVSQPIGVTGNALVYRKSYAKEAGFSEFPKDFDGMLKLARGLKKGGHPCGFSLGHAVGDANGWTHWILWGFGAKQANPDNSVAINSPETQHISP